MFRAGDVERGGLVGEVGRREQCGDQVEDGVGAGQAEGDGQDDDELGHQQPADARVGDRVEPGGVPGDRGAGGECATDPSGVGRGVRGPAHSASRTLSTIPSIHLTPGADCCAVVTYATHHRRPSEPNTAV